MRILIATHRAYPTLGGLEKHVFDYGKRIASENKDISFLNIAFESNNSEYIQHEERFAVQTIKSFFILSGSMPLPLFSAIKYYKAISQFNPDIIHTHGRYFPTTIISYLYARFNNKPLINTEHIEGEVQFPNKVVQKIINPFVDLFARMLYRYATYTTAVSQPAVDFLSRKYKREVELVPNYITPLGLDLHKKSDTEYNLKGVINHDKINMYFPYRLVKSKGYEKALKFAKQNDWLNLIIAGSGAGVGEIQKEAEKFQNIHYLGKLNFSDNISVLQQIDILLNLSSQEGLSTTILEALYFNKAIIATKIPSSEYLKDYSKAMYYNNEISKETVNKILSTEINDDEGYKLIQSIKATLNQTSASYLTIYRKFK
jgi:glycosyltransferase involved in cell wall biosynthesis